MNFHNISLSKDWSSLRIPGGGGGGDGTRKSYDVPIDLIQAISTWSTLLFTNIHRIQAYWMLSIAIGQPTTE